MKNLSWFVFVVVLALGCGDNYPGIMRFGAGSGGSIGTVADADASMAISGPDGSGNIDFSVFDASASGADLAGSSDLGPASNLDLATVDTFAVDVSSISDATIDAPLSNPDGPSVDPQSCVGFRPNEYDLTSRCRVNANCPHGMFFCNGQSMLWECVPVFGPDIWPGCFPQDAGTDGPGIIITIDAGIDIGIDTESSKVDAIVDIGLPDALPVADLRPSTPDAPLVDASDASKADAAPSPVIRCLSVEGNPSLVTVTFEGYADRSLNSPAPDKKSGVSGKKQYCVVGDFNGWSGRLNCCDWQADPKAMAFPNIPVRTPLSNSRINLTLDLGDGNEQWVDDTRVVVDLTTRCANLPGLNIVIN